MTFFNLFRKSTSSSPAQALEKTIDPNLFRELVPPVSENDWTKKLEAEDQPNSFIQEPSSKESDSSLASGKATPIDRFMARDFEKAGFDLGMEGAGREQLENATERIKVEFEFLLQQFIDFRTNELMKMKAYAMGWDLISDLIHATSMQRIEQAETRIKELSEQRIYCALGEGWVRGPILRLREGFFKGAKAFQDLNQFSEPNFYSSFNL